MASIFSVQNLHTFLRRKYLRPPGPPSRGPPGPPDRGGRRSELGACPSVAVVVVGVVSSAMLLLQNSTRVVGPGRGPIRRTEDSSRPSLPVLLRPAPGLRARLYAWRRGLP